MGFFASLHSFLLLFPSPCLRLGLESSSCRGDKIPGWDGKAAWGHRTSALATITRGPAALAAAAGSYNCEDSRFSSIPAKPNHLKIRNCTWKNHKAPTAVTACLHTHIYLQGMHRALPSPLLRETSVRLRFPKSKAIAMQTALIPPALPG